MIDRKTTLIKQIKELNAIDFVTKYILPPDGKHTNKEEADFIKEFLAKQFQIKENQIEVMIVGSSKLGYALSNKKVNNIILPRFRKFHPIKSDIDVAIISEYLYDSIWEEVSNYSYNATYFPWNSKRLGDYMICGWIRPDKLPKGLKKSIWWKSFMKLSTDRRFKYRKVRGGLFRSTYHLISYQELSILKIKKEIELSK
ncbi:hypothetical protein EHQ68_16710 [Leptospira congkakensis]|uniref:Uncharacterized protein n=1 Tax=Leptospira congkakensis TaxID=2484932 RepID=A0A8B5NB97_9LEPT|nr:hypothetical protein [Leptospira congkakensis]TGL85753.1 hypothetical protein EHQ68_16710 [Leptospira congkakensis]TGL97052.1 hypothetical protein EHQ69_00050 [Leptospira congkakensis]